MNERGISAIVATVLVILITVAAISIIWVAILPMIKDELEFRELDGRVSVVGSGGYTLYDDVEEIAMVQVKREPDEGVMNRIRVSFAVEGNSVSSSVVAPASGGTKTYSFDFSGYGEPESVSVAPIFVSGSGKEKEGTVMSDVDIPSKPIAEAPSKVELYEPGEDYVTDYSKLPSEGVVSWWKFDGDLEDSVGSNDGTFVDDAYVNEDGELVLDGDANGWSCNPVPTNCTDDGNTVDWVDIGVGSGLHIPNDISVSFWVDVGAGIVVSNGGQYGVFIDGGGSKRVRYWYWGANPNWLSFYTDYGVVPTSGWSHVVVTNVPGVGAPMPKMYVNGVEHAVSGNVQANNAGWTDLHIGEYGYTPYAPLKGLVDNVMIYNRVLSPEEVVAIYEVQAK